MHNPYNKLNLLPGNGLLTTMFTEFRVAEDLTTVLQGILILFALIAFLYKGEV